MSQIIFTNGGGVTPGSAVETLTGNTGGAVSPTANNIDVVGGENINTVGNPGTSTLTINLNESIHLPDSNTSGTTGVIYLGATGGVGGSPFLHNYDSTAEVGKSTFLGIDAGNLTNTGVFNTGIGHQSLSSLTSGVDNVSVGTQSLQLLTSGVNNIAIGDLALGVLTGGSVEGPSSYNIAIGSIAGAQLTSGSSNILIGTGNGNPETGGGDNYTSTESSNICIGNTGVTGDQNVIRIGQHDGSDAVQQNSCFIAGIFGVTVGVSGIPVVVDSTGQLGTVVSSERFKKDIQSLSDKESASLMNLRPVSFNLISEKNPLRQMGLIAEEVAQEMPHLVVFDNENKPFTVRYHDVNILLLKEVQKQHALIESLMKRINRLEQGVV